MLDDPLSRFKSISKLLILNAEEIKSLSTFYERDVVLLEEKVKGAFCLFLDFKSANRASLSASENFRQKVCSKICE